MNSSFINRDKNSFGLRGTIRTRGFTLTEILIAIALIVTIVAVAVANYVGLFTNGEAAAAHDFVTDGVDTPLMAYRFDTGNFPSTDQGLNALLSAPDGVQNWKGPYLKQSGVPLDPWQHPYHYIYPGVHNPKSYDAWSDGIDGVNGTADDIGNW